MALYGSVLTSPTALANRLRKRLEDAELRMDHLLPQTEYNPKAHCYFVPHVVYLRPFYREIRDRRVAVILFDTPLRLQELEVTWLDAKKPDTSYLLKTSGGLPDSVLDELVARLKNGTEPRPSTLSFSEIDLLPKLLLPPPDDRTLGVIQAVIYQSGTTQVQKEARRLIMTTMFADRSTAEMATRLEALFERNPEAKRRLAELVAEFQSKPGRKVLDACRSFADKKTPIAKLAKNFGVNESTLRYLTARWSEEKNQHKYISSGDFDTVYGNRGYGTSALEPGEKEGIALGREERPDEEAI